MDWEILCFALLSNNLIWGMVYNVLLVCKPSPKLRNCRNFTWCGNFVERHSFRIVSGKSPKAMRKLCLSTEFQHQEIRWNYGILRSASKWTFFHKSKIWRFLKGSSNGPLSIQRSIIFLRVCQNIFQNILFWCFNFSIIFSLIFYDSCI